MIEEKNLKTFKVYQLEIDKDVRNFAYNNSSEQILKKYPFLYSLDGFKAWNDSYFQYYAEVIVAKTVAVKLKTLEEVKVTLNLGVGNIVEDLEGNFFYLDRSGFKRFYNPQPLLKILFKLVA